MMTGCVLQDQAALEVKATKAGELWVPPIRILLIVFA